MISDSAKIPYTLNYDISPILASKFNPFNEQTLVHNQFCNFSAEKNKYTPEFKTADSSGSPFSFGRSYHEEIPFAPNQLTHPNQPIIFSSQIFNSIKSVPVTIIEKRTSFKKLISRKKNEPMIPIIINEILINGAQLRNYPFIPIEEEFTQITLAQNLIEKKNYFSINRSSSFSCSYSQRYYSFPIERLETIELTPSQLLFNNIVNYMPNERNPSKIIRKYYEDITNLLLLLNKYYFSRKPRIYSEKAVLEIERLINQCNSFTDYLRKVYIVFSHNFVVTKVSINSQHNRQMHSKKNHRSSTTFKCGYCKKKFSNGQSLGGHISQSHPNQSLKYKKKIEIRNSRVSQRMVILQSRIELFSKYSLDYEALKKDKKDKIIIRQFIAKHKTEYKKTILRKKNELLN